MLTMGIPFLFRVFDFVKARDLHIMPEDIVVIFSHRGSKTLSMQSLDITKKEYDAT